MKRLFSLALLLVCSLPVGVSISGCGVNANNYCSPPNNFTKISALYQITLQPTNNTISLAYGQTRQLATPQGENCKGSPVSVVSYNYGTSNINLLDVSPSGGMCAGTWNRNSGGGIPNFTVCTAPTNAVICSTLGQASATCDPSSVSGRPWQNMNALVTAAAAAVTSNAVQVFVHPPVTSVFTYPQPVSGPNAGLCVTPTTCGTSTPPTVPACLSQKTTINYCTLVCNAGTDITLGVGNITYGANNSSVVTFSPLTINNVINQQVSIATAQQPGSTIVTSTIAGVSSNGGYFSTCPPASLPISINKSDIVTIDPNNSQQVSVGDPTTGTVTDTRGATITVTGLTYTSTNPSTLTVSTSGAVSPTYASNGDIYAACLPPGCNPSEINQIGLPAPDTTSNPPQNPDLQTGNGLPIISNPIRVIAPGRVSSILYMVNFTTPYVSLLNNNGTVTAQPFRLPYTPNSAVVSQDGARLYFGSPTELMAYNTSNNALVAANKNVPGKVLAISPDGTMLLIYNKDPINNVAANTIFLYSTTGNGIISSNAGPAVSAHFTPDNQTAYIATGTDTSLIYNKFTGWTTTSVPGGSNAVAVTEPAVGAFFAGSSTTALGYCPNLVTTPTVYFPIAANVAANTSVLDSSNDGAHIFGANDAAGLTFYDIATSVPSGANGLCPLPNTGLTIPTTLSQFQSAGVTGDTLTGVDSTSTTFNLTAATPNTTYTAFVTYKATGTPTTPAQLPVYQTTSGVSGSTQFALIPLASTGTAVPTAPTAGAVAPDGSAFYVSTSGDNALHFINIPQPSSTAPPTGFPADNGTPIPTNLFDLNNNPLPADVVLIRPFIVNN